MQESSLAGDAAVLDPAACAREPIHVPGTIQPHGILLALEGPSFILRQASVNASAPLGRAVEAALGQPLGTLLPALELELGGRFAIPLRQIQARPGPAVHLGRCAFERERGDAGFDFLAHCSSGALILELEDADKAASDSFGAQLIRRSVQLELDGEADLSFPPGGMVCQMRFPLH